MGFFICSTEKKKYKYKNYDFLLKVENDKEIIPDYITLKIHICGIGKDDKRIPNIFTKNINNEKSENNIELHQSVLFWLIKLYSKELNETTFKDICEEIKNDRDNLKINIKQNTILYFEDNPKESHLKDIFLKKIEEMGFIYRPRLIFVTKKKSKFDFKDKRYITNIIWNDDSPEGQKKLFDKILSTIWSIDCYFNQRLNEIERFNIEDQTDIFKGLKDNPLDYSINLFLTGLSRAGKSSFINLVRGNLTALESNDKESVTSKLTEYVINVNNKDDNDDDYCSIKLIDSPGMVFDFNERLQNKKAVLDSIIKAFEDNSINKIDIVLFFFLEGNSLENTKEILNILNENNFTVLFIINRCYDEDESGEVKEISSTISFLKYYKFNNLAKKENFIPCNLKSSKRFQFYGMKDIWKRIYEILENENKLIINNSLEKKIKQYLRDNESDKMSEKMNLNEKDEKNEKQRQINNINNELYQNTLFKKIQKESIIKKCFNLSQTSFNTISRLSSIENFKLCDNIPIIHIFESILYFEIGKNYGFSKSNISSKFDKLKIELNQYIDNEINSSKKPKKNEKKKKGKGNIKEETNEEEKKLNIQKLKKRKHTIFRKIKEIVEKGNIIKKIALELKQYKEENDYLGGNNTIFKDNNFIKIIGNISQNFFEKELIKENYIPYYYKYLNIYNHCFNFIKNLSKKNDWEVYEAEYIYEDGYIDDDNNINNNISSNNKIESHKSIQTSKDENTININLEKKKNEIINNKNEIPNIGETKKNNNQENNKNEIKISKNEIQENIQTEKKESQINNNQDNFNNKIVNNHNEKIDNINEDNKKDGNSGFDTKNNYKENNVENKIVDQEINNLDINNNYDENINNEEN